MRPMSAEDYRQRAEEYDRLAGSAALPRIRETMLYAAARWRALADEQGAEERGTKPRRIRLQHHCLRKGSWRMQ